MKTKGTDTMLPVYCLGCGAELRRADDPHGDAGRKCYLWFDLVGERADTCPSCGETTSLLTTLDGAAILGKLQALPPADRAMFFDLVNRFLEDVTPAPNAAGGNVKQGEVRP